MKRACLLVILVAASLGLAQAPPAPKKPLDQIQVLALLAGGVPSPRVAMLVNERGISFEPTEDYLTTLKNVGADDVLLRAVRAAKLEGKMAWAEAEKECCAALTLAPLSRGVSV